MPELRKIIFLILTVMLTLKPAAGIISAQDVKHNSIWLSAGLQFAGTRDLVYSPLLYSGTDAAFNLGYSYTGNSFSHGAELLYSSGSYEASSGSTMSTENGELRFGYHRSVYSFFENRIKLSAGAVGDICFLMRTYNLVPTVGGSIKISPSPEFYSSLNIALSGEYKHDEKNWFNCRLWLPLASYFLRSEYTEHAGDRLRPAKDAGVSDLMDAAQTSLLFGDYFHAGSSVSYQRKLSEYFVFGAEYSLLYQKVNIPMKKEIFNNAFRCRIAFIF